MGGGRSASRTRPQPVFFLNLWTITTQRRGNLFCNSFNPSYLQKFPPSTEYIWIRPDLEGEALFPLQPSDICQHMLRYYQNFLGPLLVSMLYLCIYSVSTFNYRSRWVSSIHAGVGVGTDPHGQPKMTHPDGRKNKGDPLKWKIVNIHRGKSDFSRKTKATKILL